MFDAMYIGATGMQAQQLGINTIANNLANVNTAAFKKTRVNFTDLMTVDPSAAPVGGSSVSGSNAVEDAGPLAAIPRLGVGVGVASMETMFDQGTLNQTGSVWDVAIQGDGFLPVTMADGSTEYTRGGTLKVNADGLLATQSGQPLKPNIAVPADASQLSIGADGTVTATVSNQNAPVTIGQLQMVRFANPTTLLAQTGNLFSASDSSGEPIASTGGQDGIGTLQQGSLEGSNVTMVDEMVNLMVAQQAYQATVKVVQAADEMLGMVNNLRK
jgi:flagellar basal-body rod protein FlgG